MPLLLGLDLGTSYFKVGLFDAAGELRGLGRVATDVDTPAPGRVELPASAFWQRLRQALDQACAQPGDVAGISYSSQANTFLLLDESGNELTPLIFWNDQRARPLEPELEAFSRTPWHAQVTGMREIAPERMPAKCRWLARHKPRVWGRARSVLTIADYLACSLTGQRVGDASTAVLTGLYSLPDRCWWTAALEVFGLKEAQLVRPLPPGSPAGRTTARATALLGLPAGIPFAVGALDHHAAALGSGLGAVADASLSTGTVLAALVLVDKVEPAAGCIHGPHPDGERFYRLAFDPQGAGQLEDYQRKQAPNLTIEELLRQAEKAAGAGDAADAAGHGAAVLALLRSIAIAQRGLLARVAGQAPVQRVTATGGGARSAFWLQVTADAIGVPVVAVASPERACLGAALFAAVAAGVWPDLRTAAQRMVKPPREYHPAGQPSR
jgi:xylulokinase